MKNSVIISDSDIMGGTPVFKGTRVPVQYLFERIEDGETLDEFIKSYPTVTKKQAIDAIKLAEKLIEKLMSKNENPSG